MTLINKIAAVITSLTLVFAIGGVTIFQHHCHCENDSSVSVFVDESCCTHQDYQATSCSQVKENAKSCCSNAAENDHKCDQENKDCCPTDTKFFKLANPFNIPVNSGLVKTFTHLFIGILFSHNFDNTPLTTSPLLSLTDTSPPFKEKVSILIGLHQLKLSPDHLS